MFIIQGWGTDQRVWPQWLKDSGTCYSKNLPQFQVVEQEFLQCFSVKQKKLTILGWSLGSMLALELAHKHGDKIAQLVIVECKQVKLQQVDNLNETIRGENGFGHTGIQ